MDAARLFQSARSQAARLPKAYRFSGTEVIVKHFGNGVPLLPIEDLWQTIEAGLSAQPRATGAAAQAGADALILLDTNLCIHIINAKPPAVLHRFRDDCRHGGDRDLECGGR